MKKWFLILFLSYGYMPPLFQILLSEGSSKVDQDRSGKCEGSDSLVITYINKQNQDTSELQDFKKG